MIVRPPNVAVLEEGLDQETEAGRLKVVETPSAQLGIQDPVVFQELKPAHRIIPAQPPAKEP